MAEEVKPEVIKKTQDSLKKHIKKPPLTEKLLKKPPFRFLHDIITNIIRDTGFLDGLFSAEELNHENIKDRDGKIAFLDKLISAVKIITGIPLSVRATKIVAGHEPTKTNELLQAIGLALDKKLDSKDVAQQLRKKGSKKSDASNTKKASPREAKQEKSDAGKSKSKERAPNQSEENSEKRKPSTHKQGKEDREETTEKKKRSSSTSKQTKAKESSKTPNSSRDGGHPEPQPEKQIPGEDVPNRSPLGEIPDKESAALEISPDAEQKKYQTAVAQRRSSALKQHSEDKSQQPQSDQLLSSSANSSTEKTTADSQISPQESDQPPVSILPPLLSEQSSNNKGSKAPPPVQVASSAAPSQIQSQPQAQPQAPAPVPLVRPRTAARVGSARPGAPRVRNRGEALVVTEEVKQAPVNLIVEDNDIKTSHEDEDENLVVVETATGEEVTDDLQPSAPAMSRPASQQGHLVAQILETQKELEVGLESGEIIQHHTEIEWEAGKKREREAAIKEVDRMRTLIQTLTRAAHPLGKLLDSLQEDVDNMQRELNQWLKMQTSLEQQLQMEETLSSQASQPLKEQLKQLQQAISSQLDLISSAKANIISNDDRIRKLLTGGQ